MEPRWRKVLMEHGVNEKNLDLADTLVEVCLVDIVQLVLLGQMVVIVVSCDRATFQTYFYYQLYANS